MLRDLLCYAKVKPVCNQIELNPQCVQLDLVAFCKSVDIVPVAYTPVARPGAVERGDQLAPSDWPDLREDPLLKEIAAAHGKSVVQVMLNWGLCRGHVVIPKAVSLAHQQENAAIFDFRLTEEQITQITGLDTRLRLCGFKQLMGGMDFFC